MPDLFELLGANPEPKRPKMNMALFLRMLAQLLEANEEGEDQQEQPQLLTDQGEVKVADRMTPSTGLS